MTWSEMETSVDLNYFQENNSFLVADVSNVNDAGSGFAYVLAYNEEAPYYGCFFFPVDSNENAAIVIFKKTDTKANDPVMADGILPFEKAEAVAEAHRSPVWQLRELE